MEWKISHKPVEYQEALTLMERRVQAISVEEADELIWFLEHPSLYTAGTSSKVEDLLLTNNLPVYSSGRGGQYTYHGPGQRIVYCLLNLKHRELDLRKFVWCLEETLIQTLRVFGIESFRREGRVGLWVSVGLSESKIAAIGVRVQRSITLHGAALNVFPDLNHYKGIVPCGLREYGVTSMEALGVKASLEDIDSVLQPIFTKVFDENLPIKS